MQIVFIAGDSKTAEYTHLWLCGIERAYTHLWLSGIEWVKLHLYIFKVPSLQTSVSYVLSAPYNICCNTRTQYLIFIKLAVDCIDLAVPNFASINDMCISISTNVPIWAKMFT